MLNYLIFPIRSLLPKEVLILCSILVFLSIECCILAKKRHMCLQIIGSILLIVAITFGASTAYVWTHARIRGCYEEKSIGFMEKNLSKMPIEDRLPNRTVPKGSIVILYKYGCKDCLAVFPELDKKLSHADGAVYRISCQSPIGKELCKTYQVQEVPSAIYQYRNRKGASTSVIYDTDNDANSVLDRTAVDRLLYLQSEKQ